MTRKAGDRRIEKTRGALRSALFALLLEHDLADITVRALCDRANVARSSFYLHYDSATALLEETIGERLRAELLGRPDGQSAIEWLVDHVTANRALFRRTVAGARGAAVLERFKSGFIAALSEDSARSHRPPTDVQLHFLAGGAFEAVLQWSRTWRTSRLPALKRDLRALEAKLLS